ncbi:putative arsenite transmembrane transporter protein, partial [Aureobasidium melanogenum]
MAEDLDTSQIKEWRSIVTLIVFLLTNIVVLFPFKVPIYVPRSFYNAILNVLSVCRIIPPRRHGNAQNKVSDGASKFVRMNFSMSFSTAPLIADLFLLAISAIGRQEVHDGTVGADNISPIDIMVFFVTLAYIAISIDASGLIRFLAFKVLQKGGKVGHLLFFYLYAFFFSLGAFVGNDPIILSGTAFLAYMTRVSSNIDHPRAWMYSQFSIANIASAILVSSNPTNLVLAGAFQIKFIVYTANMIVPVVVTAIVLFPFLLYVVFASPQLIPLSIEMETLSDEAKSKKPVNPNIPQAKGKEPEDDEEESPENKELALAEIMNPFLDKGGATFGSVVMAVALITLLGINAASSAIGEHPVFWITLPAATIMFCWDVAYGWRHRKETREIAKRRQAEFRQAQEGRANSETQTGGMFQTSGASSSFVHVVPPTPEVAGSEKSIRSVADMSPNAGSAISPAERDSTNDGSRNKEASRYESHETNYSHTEKLDSALDKAIDEEKTRSCEYDTHDQPTSLVSFIAAKYRWLQETFPTVMAVLGHLPLKLVPFALSMFVLIQGLVTKGWVPVFAYGWDHWVSKTGTIGAIGGMGFLGVILCNFAGTNIGTTILLSRVIQAWQQIHINNGIPITDRTFWATVYAMALGVNYGAFSIAFSASLAGLLWRDILSRKHIHVRRLDFARENIPIIAVAMVVGCAVLVEVFVLPVVYITAEDAPAATATILAGTATASSDPSATHIFDSAEDLAIALSSASTPASATTSTLAERAATCVPQPPGISHTSLPDSAGGFVSDTYYYDQAVSVSTPSDWVRAFTGLNASNSAERCLGFTLLPFYDVQACANKCASLSSCDSINMYFERDPSTSIDNTTCTNPSGVTNVKCVLWKGAVATSNANNFGQRRAEFQVVVAGSSGFIKSSLAASLPVNEPDEPSATTFNALPTATSSSNLDTQPTEHVSASNKNTALLTIPMMVITLALIAPLDYLKFA